MLAFAIKLLNRPADAAFLVGNGRVAGRHLVGHAVVRPVGGHQYAEEFRFAIIRYPIYFQYLILPYFLVRPAQSAHRLVGLLVAGIINEAVTFQGAIKGFAHRQQPLEQVRSGVPAIHQHGSVGNAAQGQLGQHIGYVVELGLAIPVGGEEAVIKQPELVGFGVDVHASDQADASNHAVGVAAVLVADQFDASAVVLVEHRVVEQDVAPGGEYDLRAHLLLALAGREMTGSEKIAYVIVREPVQMVGQVRARVVHLVAHQKLPVKLRGYFHGFSFQVTPFA